MSAASLDRLHADPALRAREFPVVRERTFLAHAAVCPLPARVARAMADFLERVQRTGQFEFLFRGAEAEGRELAAGMLGAQAQEIAYIPSTSAGLAMVATGLPWRAGDNVLIAEPDFPANVYPWLALEEKGVEVRRIPRRTDGRIDPDDVAAVLDERTRLGAFSSVDYFTGAPLDVAAVGELLHGRGALFCLDAIQSLGALPTSMQEVDFLAADAHKWLLGPQGTGVFCVRAERMAELRPTLVGWRSVAEHEDFATVDPTLAPTARRYEPGSLGAIGVVGLAAALALLTELGVERIAAHLRQLRGLLLEGLAEKGYRALGPGPEAMTGITTFHAEGRDMKALWKRLDEAGIVTSLRTDTAGRAHIRVSPHGYTSREEIERLLTML